MSNAGVITPDDYKRWKLQREVNGLVDEKLGAGEAVPETWVVETMLARHEGLSADDAREAFRRSAKRFEPPDTAEGHSQHAAELRRYLRTRLARARPRARAARRHLRGSIDSIDTLTSA